MENIKHDDSYPKFRIVTNDRRIKFAGTDFPSWFNLADAKKLVNYSDGEMIYESDGMTLLWEVL